MKIFHLLSLIFLFSISLNAAVTSSVETRILHNSIGSTDSKVSYIVTLSNGWIQGTSSITSLKVYNVTTGSSVLVYTHPTATVNTGIVLSLTPGTYQFVGNASTLDGRSFVSVNINQYFWVGNKTEWQNVSDVARSISQDDLIKNQTSLSSTYGFAQSFNASASSSSDAWIELKKSNNLTSGDNRLYWILEPISNLSTFSPASNISYIEFKTLNGVTTNTLKYKLSNGTYTTMLLSNNSADKFRLVRKSNTTYIQKNSDNTVLQSLINISGVLKISLVFNNVGVEAAEITSSLTTPSTAYPFEVTENTATNSSQLTIRISPYTGTVAPYNYFLSQNPIEEVKTIYRIVKDSINGGVLDSALFFRGSNSALSQTFTNLENGFYHVAVFDSRGVRVQSFGKLIEQSFSLSEARDIINRDGDYFTTKSSGYFTDNFFTNEETDSKLTVRFKNTVNDQSFGFLNISTSFNGSSSTYSNLFAGVNVINGMIYLVDRGTIIGSGVAINQTDRVEIEKTNSVVSFYLNGGIIGTLNLPSTFDLKTGGFLKGWGSLINVVHGTFSKTPFRISNTVTNNLCSNDNVNLNLTVPGAGSTDLFGNAFVSKNLQLYNFLEGNVTVGAVNQTVFNGIAPGVYLLSGSIVFGTTTYPVNRYFYVGVQNNWENQLNLSPQTSQVVYKPHGIATTAVNGSTGVYGEGVSSNQLMNNTKGWICFKFLSSKLYKHSFDIVGLTESPQIGFINSFNSNDFQLLKSNFGSILLLNNPDIQSYSMFTMPSSEPLLISRNTTGVVRITQNGNNLVNPINSISFNRWKLSMRANKANCGMINILSNFKCFSAAGQYAQLKYEMDGYYHVMKNGYVNFVYNQEYNSSILKFNLYNPNGELVRTNVNFPVINVTNGANYISLDVRGQYCIGTGFFYLEFINDKKEKSYLRFYNDYTDVNCNYPIGSDEQSQ